MKMNCTTETCTRWSFKWDGRCIREVTLSWQSSGIENHYGWRLLLLQWMTRRSKCLAVLHNSCWGCLFDPWTIDQSPLLNLLELIFTHRDLQIHYLTESQRLTDCRQLFAASPIWFTGMWLLHMLQLLGATSES